MLPVWIVLVLASAAGVAAALCAGLVLGTPEERKQLAWPALAVLTVFALRFGGGALLEGLGLDWRRPVVGVMALGAVLLAVLTLVRTGKLCARLVSGRSCLELMLAVCFLGTTAALICSAGIAAFFGSWSDQVRVQNGEKTVVESAGIFREKGYRYVNQIVHGELLWEWED